MHWPSHLDDTSRWKFIYRLTHFSLVSADAEALETAESHSCGPDQNVSNSPEQDQKATLSNTPPTAAEMVPPNSTSPGPDEAITQSERWMKKKILYLIDT